MSFVACNRFYDWNVRNSSQRMAGGSIAITDHGCNVLLAIPHQKGRILLSWWMIGRVLLMIIRSRRSVIPFRSFFVVFLLTIHLSRQLGLILSATRVPKLGSESRKLEFLSGLGWQKPKEAMMFYANFPKPFGRPVIGQFEADGWFKLFEFTGT